MGVKISAATNVASLVGTDEVGVYDGTSATKAATIDDFKDYFETQGQIAAKVNRTTQLTVTTGTWTEVVWEAAMFNLGALWDSSANQERLIVPAGEGGEYLIRAQARWVAAASAHTIGTRLKINGIVVVEVYSPSIKSATLETFGQAHEMAALAVADFVTLEVWQNSGSNKTIEVSQTSLVGMKLAAS